MIKGEWLPVKTRIYTILEIAFIALFIFSCCKLIGMLSDYNKGDNIYKESREEFTKKTEPKKGVFGLDFEIEQGGKNLSGGQRQRLTIARALIKKPEILILDDSASALDYATDLALRRSLAALSYKPTVFIVSQRASSILHADKIAVLDEGKMVGLGTHEELMRTCPVYREIYYSQYEQEVKRDA